MTTKRTAEDDAATQNVNRTYHAARAAHDEFRTVVFRAYAAREGRVHKHDVISALQRIAAAHVGELDRHLGKGTPTTRRDS